MRKKELLKKAIVATMMTTMLIGATACGKSEGATKDTGSDKEVGRPIQIQGIFWGAEIPTEEAALVKEVEKATGVELDISYILADTATERISTTILSGKIPEVMCVKNEDVHSKLIEDAVKGGMFWDLTDYIKDYPNLDKAMTDTVKRGLTVDGKLIALPRGTFNRGGGLILREDWLEKLNLSVPESLDDFYKTFKAFTENDPDGNGKKDTIGLSMYGGAFVRPLMVAAGAPYDWYVDEETGKVQPEWMHKNFMTYLDFVKKLYDENLINTDFAAANATSAREMILQQKAGGYPASIGNIISGTQYDALYQNNKDAKLVSVTKLKQEDGTYAAEQAAGYYGAYFISKKTITTEERLREVLQFFDDSMKEEVASLYYKGLKDVHYKETADGKFEWADFDKFLVDSKGLPCINVYPLLSANMSLNLAPHADEYYEFQNDTSIKDYPMASVWFMPNTDSAGVEGIVESAATKYVMGDMTKEDVQKTIQQWIDGGGQAHMDDWTEQYKKMVK